LDIQAELQHKATDMPHGNQNNTVAMENRSAWADSSNGVDIITVPRPDLNDIGLEVYTTLKRMVLHVYSNGGGAINPDIAKKVDEVIEKLNLHKSQGRFVEHCLRGQLMLAGCTKLVPDPPMSPIGQISVEAYRSDFLRAEAILLRLGIIVTPILLALNMRIGSLAEMVPQENNPDFRLLGLNIDSGANIYIRLRSWAGMQRSLVAFGESTFMPFHHLLDSLLHEIAHNLFSDHGFDFLSLWNQLRFMVWMAWNEIEGGYFNKDLFVHAVGEHLNTTREWKEKEDIIQRSRDQRWPLAWRRSGLEWPLFVANYADKEAQVDTFATKLLELNKSEVLTMLKAFWYVAKPRQTWILKMLEVEGSINLLPLHNDFKLIPRSEVLSILIALFRHGRAAVSYYIQSFEAYRFTWFRDQLLPILIRIGLVTMKLIS
jgi:hypothetical protein